MKLLRWLGATLVIVLGGGAPIAGCGAAESTPAMQAEDGGANDAMVSSDVPSTDANVRDADRDAGDVASLPLGLESSAFVDNGTLPQTFTCDGAGTSPPLRWKNVPPATVELALMMTTLAKDGLKWNWVLYRLPPSAAGLEENSVGVGVAGLTSDGPALAYAPPCSQGPGAKGYVFTLYALSAAPGLPAVPNQVTGPVLTSAVEPLVLGKASLTVSYTRPL